MTKSIKIIPLAAESLGSRSLACIIKTPNISILIDPGCALGSNNGNKIPHPLELKRNEQLTHQILKNSQEPIYLFISHYHRDHFKPPIQDYFYINSDDAITKMLYQNKQILAKNRDNLGHFQKMRANALFDYCKFQEQEVLELHIDLIIKFQYTFFHFPEEIAHSIPNSKLGSVQPIIIRYKSDEAVFYYGDVHGFIGHTDISPVIENIEEFSYIKHKIMIFGGPTEQILSNTNRNNREKLLTLYKKLLESCELLIIDHHPFRMSNKNLHLWTSIVDELNKNKINVLNYYQYMQYENTQTLPENYWKDEIHEGNREILFNKHPVSSDYIMWAEECLKKGSDMITKKPPL